MMKFPHRSAAFQLLTAVAAVGLASCATGRASRGQLSPKDWANAKIRAMPAFQVRAQGLDEAGVANLSAKLARDGMPKLSDKQLLRRTQLQAMMFEKADVDTCGNIARGTPAAGDADRLVGTVSEDSQQDYYAILAAAVSTELGVTPPAVSALPTIEKTSEAMNHLIDQLPPGDRPIFASNLAGIAKLPNDLACKTIRKLYGLVLASEGETQGVTARALTMQ